MAKKPKLVDLCKVNTDAFRHMTQAQLKRVEKTIGPHYNFKASFDKAYTLVHNPRAARGLPPRKSPVVNRIVSEFVYEIRASREPDDPAVRPHYEAAARKRGAEPLTRAEQVAAMERRADKLERAIWDLQTRVGCTIKGPEQVARDAARADKPEAVARIRKKPLIR